MGRPLNSRSLLLLLLCLGLAFPGTNYQVFSGLPLSSWPEFVLGASILPLLLSRHTRERFDSFVSARILHLFNCLLLGAVALKLVLLCLGADRGLRACYTTPAAPPPGTSACEWSFEHPLHRWNATRLDPSIDFERHTWRLGFVNSLRFNFYNWIPGTIRRDWMPLSVTWSGYIQPSATRAVRVTWTGAGSIRVGSAHTELPRQYGFLATKTFAIEPGLQRVLITYIFDDGARAGRDPTPPYATFKVDFMNERGEPIQPELTPSRRALRAAPAIALASDLVFFGFGVLLALFYVRALGPDLRWALPAATAVWLLAHVDALDTPFGPRITWPLWAVAMTLFIFTLVRRNTSSLVLAYGILLAFCLTLGKIWYSDIGTVAIRPGGDDWLTYESFARTILETRSLEGGEPVFYYQPLFRYLLAAERLLLGEGELLLVASRTTALLLAGIWAGLRLAGRSRTLRWPVAAFVVTSAALMLAVMTSAGVRFIPAPASEYPTWVLLPVSVGLLFGPASPRSHITAALLLGLQAVTRVNQLPGILLTYIAFVTYSRPRPRVLATCSALFLAVLTLPLLHNWFYGGQLVLFTTSVDIPENLRISPIRAATTLDSPETRALLINHARLVLGWAQLDSLLRFGIHGTQLLWLTVLLGAVARSPRLNAGHWLLLAVPVTYLGIHLVYQVDVYYPRHIIAGYITMALGSLTVGVAQLQGSQTAREEVTEQKPPDEVRASVDSRKSAVCRRSKTGGLRIGGDQ